MDSEESSHSHYWPGEGCIPITPQAKRLGWSYPVYVTHAVWSRCITWTKGKGTNPDKRIFELLESSWKGMGKALADEPERVGYTFKHWFWERDRLKAKKQSMSKFSARLLLDPDTEEPWILIFDPRRDTEEVLKHGDPEQYRVDDGQDDRCGDPVLSDGSILDFGEEAVRDFGSEQ